jgi:hypothetical protein
MPTVAAYTVISSATVTIPDPTTASNHHHYEFDAPNVNDEFPSILVFRMGPAGGVVRVQVRINGRRLIDTAFRTPYRSWHEVVARHSLREQGNQLTVLVPSSTPRKVLISDIVLLYKVNVP